MADLDAVRATFSSAGEAFLDLVETIPSERYDGPGMGDWSLRSLLGHTGRSFETVASYLPTRAETVAADSAGSYFALTLEVAARAPDQILQRGIDAGRALGDDPLASLRESRARAEAALDALAGEDPVIGTIVGGMRASAYLPTRTFELVVHSLDVARALGATPWTPPADALAESLAAAADSAVVQGLGVDVLLALTGRQSLPPGCTVVP